MKMFDYFHMNENEQYLFLQMPLTLIKDDQFKSLSDSSKILYSLLLNRTALSAKNGWTDEHGRVYIIYTLEEIMTDLNCWEKKALKAMKELKEIGLVKSIRQGLGKPNIIYVMNFATALKYQSKNKKVPTNPINTQNCHFDSSGTVKRTVLELSKEQCSNIDINKTEYESESKSKSCQTENQKMTNDMTNDFDIQQRKLSKQRKGLPQTIATQSTGLQSPSNNTCHSINNDYTTYRTIIQENINYNYFSDYRETDIGLVDELINCMLDVILTKGETVKINGEDKNRNMVIGQYLNLNMMDIEHILDRYKNQRQKITHLHNYLKTMLYTVKQESGHYYANAVRADGIVH